MRRLFLDIFDEVDLETFLVLVMPLRRSDFALGCGLAVLIHYLGLYYIEYLFRVNITAGFALAPVAIHLVGRFLKISDGLYGCAIVSLESTGVHDNHLVKHLVYVGRRLMDDNKDQFSPH